MLATAEKSVSACRNIAFPLWLKHVNDDGSLRPGWSVEDTLEATLHDIYRDQGVEGGSGDKHSDDDEEEEFAGNNPLQVSGISADTINELQSAEVMHEGPEPEIYITNLYTHIFFILHHS